MKKQSKKKNFEITFCENLIKAKPDSIPALIYLGGAYTRKGFYQEGLEMDKRLVDLRPQDPVFRYNLACSLSLLGEVDSSFEELKKAVMFGYDDVNYILVDSDLDNLRKDGRFDIFFHKVKKLQPKNHG